MEQRRTPRASRRRSSESHGAHYQKSGEVTLPWVYQTLRNVIGNEYRRRRNAPFLVEDPLALDDVTGPDDRLPDAVMTRGALAQLAESDREVLFMAYWQDLSTAEMAQILECSTTAVRVRLFRARRRLHHRMLAGAETEKVGEA